jgi:hypothetical protein
MLTRLLYTSTKTLPIVLYRQPFIAPAPIISPFLLFKALRTFKMETSEYMAVVAPDTSSTPAFQASHVPEVHPSAQPQVNGSSIAAAARSDRIDEDSGDDIPLARKPQPKRTVASSDEDEKPLAKKPRASAGGKKRRIMDSDSEDEVPVSI